MMLTSSHSTSANGRHGGLNGSFTTAAADWSSSSFHSQANGTTNADEATIDVYAMKVLEDASPPDICVDADYLGPYITGVLRAENVQMVEDLPDYDNMLELLQEHCSMARQDAKLTLQKIAQAVVSGTVPVEPPFPEVVSSPQLGPFSSPPASGGLTALQLLETFNVEEAVGETKSASATAPSSALKVNTTAEASSTKGGGGPNSNTSAQSIISPVQPDNLIPVDLLGAIDAEYNENGTTTSVNNSITTTPIKTMPASTNNLDVPITAPAASPAPTFSPTATLAPTAAPTTTTAVEAATPHNPIEEEFPSLAVAAKVSKRSSRSSRSRQGSIDETSLLSDHSSSNKNNNNSSNNNNNNNNNNTSSLQQEQCTPVPVQHHHQEYQQQQQQQQAYYYGMDGTTTGGTEAAADPATMLQMACDMLTQMNPDIGQDAIFQACTMANANVAVAQYLIDCAMTAPPVCRHLLHSGCYRSDCQFSHDLEGHTCVFWLRGHCNKGAACPFLHGFNEKWLIQLEEHHQQQAAEYAAAAAAAAEQQQEAADYYSATNPYAQQEGSSWDQQQQSAAPVVVAPAPAPTTTTSTAQPLATSTNSFANIASQGYNDRTCFQQPQHHGGGSGWFVEETKFATPSSMRIPQDVWNPHERRDASAFHIADPMERYREVSRSTTRADVIDLHFQSTKTFGQVLKQVLPEKLGSSTTGSGIWIVTGTGHHVGSKTHQKGGGILESAVQNWLAAEGYEFWKGKDRNGHGGAVFVKKQQQGSSSNNIQQ